MQKNKITSYLLYAVGEIVLVVIGILIAVTINSLYTTSQNEKKVETILRQMQKELLVDIADAKRISGVFIQKDSLAQKIFADDVAVTSRFDLGNVVIDNFYVSFTTKRDAYNRLMQNLEILPEKYNTLLPLISNMYVELQNDIDDHNTAIKNTVVNNSDIYLNPQAADIILGKTSEEVAIDFFLTNPLRKNTTLKYISDFRQIALSANDYRIKSIELYHQIDAVLGNKDKEKSELISAMPKGIDMRTYIGDYEFMKSSSPVPIDSITVSIRLEKDKLISSSPRVDRVDLYWDRDTFFFEEGNMNLTRFYKNNSDQRVMESSDGIIHYFFIHSKDLK